MDAAQVNYILGRLVQANDDAQAIILALKDVAPEAPVDHQALLRHAIHIAMITHELDDRIRHHDMPAIEMP
ncbi:MAG TPA: hypothetical protein VN905_07190 [Candidatus Binatia bacterium]|nr:hypothetical protein [Candidatus Binatia bacterium]